MSFLGSLFGAGPNAQQKASYGQLQTNAANAGTTGMGFLGSSQQAFQAPTSYYSSILSGNPADVAGALSPQISQLNAGFAQGRNQVDQFAPMGGGRSSVMANLPFQKASAITNLISQARQAAAQGLTGIGTAEGGLGGNLLGISSNAASNLGQLGTEQQQFQYQAGAGIGSAIGALLAGPLAGPLKGLFGGGGGGGGSSAASYTGL